MSPLPTPPAFPVLPGQGWSVHKRPSFSTRIASHVSGREVRRANYAQTLYEFELTFDGLSSAGSLNALPGLGTATLQTLMGFFLACQGQLNTFLYTDPSDGAVEGQPLGTGDGSTTAFTLLRALGGTVEPVGWATAVSNVAVAGAPLAASAYALVPPTTLSFTAAPAAGALVTADIAYAFPCRFTDDQVDFENVMAGLWQVSRLTFRSVRTA